MHPYVRPTVEDDIHTVAANMRYEDVAEVRAASGLGPLRALDVAFKWTPQCWTIAPEWEDPIAIFGITPYPAWERAGICWLLGTEGMLNHRKVFLRNSVEVLREVSRDYELIFNLVDERNTVHIRWLKWCGFSFLRRVIAGVEERPFLEFARLTHV